MYYTTQWNFIILSKFSHMTLTSSNEKWMRVADIVRRFCHFLYKGENFTLMVWAILSLRKLIKTAMHWQNWLILSLKSLTFYRFFLDSVLLYYLLIKKHSVASLKRAHSTTWYKQKRRWNRWASKQVSRP